MPKYNVEILRMTAATVEVQADSPEDAADQVDKRDFPLPPAEEWQSLEGWEYVVYDHTHQHELLRRD